jgi:gluconolactonase
MAADDARSAIDRDIVPMGSKIEELWDQGHFTEGVAAGPDGLMYFSDIALDNSPGRVMKFDPATNAVTVHCADSGKSNGLMFDPKGRLIACCGALYGKRALVEILPDGELKVLVDQFEGKPLNSPNDLVIDGKGRVYFTDPRYLGPEPLDLEHMSVYRFDPDGKLHRATTDIEKPNGVYLSPDGEFLYVAETNNGTTNIEEGKTYKLGRMTLNAFPIQKNGNLGKKKVLIDFGDQTGIDGMTVDQKGNIYAAVRSSKRFGIVVYDRNGKERTYLPTPELPTNCKFGTGDEAKTLYITAGKSFYRINLAIEGYHPAMGKSASKSTAP